MAISTRPAISDDVDVIAGVHVVSRASYYGDLLDPGDAAKDRTPMWQRWLMEPSRTTVIAEADGDVVGFISTHHFDASDELVALYVLPPWFGTGVAVKLYEQFEIARGSHSAHLEVWDGNDRARSFYRRRRWVPTEQTRPGVAGVPFRRWELH